MLIGENSPLFAPLAQLAAHAHVVFFVGLPGTGKSLLVRELAHLAHALGRRVQLLQWDVARPAFEASDAGQRYPQHDGITHGVIRLAAGGWARAAVARWHAAAADVENLLVGEAPFIGHRFIELARPAPDEAEPVLAAPSTRFVIPVPSQALRAHLETERERRVREPIHPREREDAPPQVLRALFRDVARVAAALGVAGRRADTDAAYDPIIYRRVYERLLEHRHVEAIAIDTQLPTAGVSAYDVRVPAPDLVPTPDEAARSIREVEARFPDPADIEREVDRWYCVSPTGQDQRT